MFVALEGIDGAGKTTAVDMTVQALRARGWAAEAIHRRHLAGCSQYVTEHMAALRQLIWEEPAGSPYLDLGDEHWVHLQAAWYSALAHCVVTPTVERGTIAVADTWGYKFLAKLRLRPPTHVDYERAFALFTSLPQPDLTVWLHTSPHTAAQRKQTYTPSETGNHTGPPDLSPPAFSAYQQRLQEIFTEFADRGHWPVVTTDDTSPEQVGQAICDIVARAAPVLAPAGHQGAK